jgi:hypothetical protein
VRARQLAGVILLGTAFLAFATEVLKAPMVQLFRDHEQVIGSSVVEADAWMMNLHGARQRVLSTDSLTLVILVEPGSLSDRLQARELGSLQEWARLQGLSLRFVVVDSAGAGQFARLSGRSGDILVATPAWLGHIRFRDSPDVLFVDRQGILRARWTGRLPRHLSILNELDRGITVRAR